MITDNQVKKLRSTFMNPKSTVQTSALKVNVCENTARKYLQKENRLPCEIITERPPRQYLCGYNFWYASRCCLTARLAILSALWFILSSEWPSTFTNSISSKV